MRTLRLLPLVNMFIWMMNVVQLTLILAERPITGRELVLPFGAAAVGSIDGGAYTVSSGATSGNVLVDAACARGCSGNISADPEPAIQADASGFLRVALNDEPDALTFQQLADLLPEQKKELFYRGHDGALHPLVDALDRLPTVTYVPAVITSRDELLKMLRTVPPGLIMGIGYVGDDGDWHALTEADLKVGTCICSIEPAVTP